MTTNHEIEVRTRELAGEMQAHVMHDQYREDLESVDSRRAFGQLVVGFAQRNELLSPQAIDYTVDALGARHAVTANQFEAMTRGIQLLNAEEAEDKLRVIHVALEVSHTINETDIYEFSRGLGDASETRVDFVDRVGHLLRRVEQASGEKLDAEGLLQVADEYTTRIAQDESDIAMTKEQALDSIYNVFEQDDDESEADETETERGMHKPELTSDSVLTLIKATDAQLTDFLKTRYSTDATAQKLIDEED